MLLAIDTTVRTSVAIVDRDAGILAEINEDSDFNRVALIGDAIARALKLAETNPVSLSGVAIGIGPGPAHDVNIGIAAAHGFASALNRPVVRVISHDAVMLDRPYPAVVVSTQWDRMIAWTPYGAPDSILGLPNPLSEPSFDLPGVGFPSETRRVAAEEIRAGAVGMLAERIFASGRSFAAKHLYAASH